MSVDDRVHRVFEVRASLILLDALYRLSIEHCASDMTFPHGAENFFLSADISLDEDEYSLALALV